MKTRIRKNHILSSQAFKLFDMDGDGMITKDELKKLVEKVRNFIPSLPFKNVILGWWKND